MQNTQGLAEAPAAALIAFCLSFLGFILGFCALRKARISRVGQHRRWLVVALFGTAVSGIWAPAMTETLGISYLQTQFNYAGRQTLMCALCAVAATVPALWLLFTAGGRRLRQCAGALVLAVGLTLSFVVAASSLRLEVDPMLDIVSVGEAAALAAIASIGVFAVVAASRRGSVLTGCALAMAAAVTGAGRIALRGISVRPAVNSTVASANGLPASAVLVPALIVTSFVCLIALFITVSGLSAHEQMEEARVAELYDRLAETQRVEIR